MLKITEDYNQLKTEFSNKFQLVLKENFEFKNFMYELFFYGTAYVVGGFIRDIILNKQSRDMDIIINLPYQSILKVIESSTLSHKKNRLNGFKIYLENFEVDIWSIDYNWAFKNKLVTLNDEKVVDSIAKGSFYNFDSLVINVHTLNLNIKEFNHFVKNNKLDIIQKNKKYKILNPTIEANILRAFYIRKMYNITYSENCNDYLISRIGFLEDKYYSCVKRLLEIKSKYAKYDEVLNETTLKESISYCFRNTENSRLRL